MDDATEKLKSSSKLLQKLVACVNKALTDDLHRYLAEFSLQTTNGVPHNIGDWINTNIRDSLTFEHVEIKKFQRSSWTGILIIDRGNRVSYSVMRRTRVFQLPKEQRDRPHYLQSILAVVNQNLEASCKQMPLFEPHEYSLFDSETLTDDFNSIAGDVFGVRDDYTHCVIAYDTSHGSLIDISALILDKDFDIVEDYSLNEYIQPDFAALTNMSGRVASDKSTEHRSSKTLISLKQKAVDTPDSPVQIRKMKKQA